MPDPRSLLIVTPYFAPQSHAAVFRAYKLAKHLALSGWNVHILTVDRNYLYNEDTKLSQSLPPNVKVHTARYIEPTLRGLRMWLGGKDRTFRAIKFDAFGSHVAERSKISFLGKIYRAMRERLNIPDVYWTWRRPAIRMGEKIIREFEIEVVMTSSLPYTTIQIGAELQKRCGVKWVADFRDPMSYERRLHSPKPKIFGLQKNIERMAVENADAVTCLSSAHPLILADTYGVDKTKHVRFIPTGVEKNLVSQGSQGKTTDPYLIFVGEFLAEYGDEFFKVFNEALKDPQISNTRIKIVGRLEVNQARIAPLIANLQCRSHVEFVDHLPQAEVYELIRTAKAAVLCTSRSYPWWAAFAKLSDFMALHKTVVAIVPNPSEARKWLQLSGLGVFLDGSIEESATRLKEFLKNPNASTSGVEEYCRTFYVDHQVNEFKKVFTECFDKGAEP